MIAITEHTHQIHRVFLSDFKLTEVNDGGFGLNDIIPGNLGEDFCNNTDVNMSKFLYFSLHFLKQKKKVLDCYAYLFQQGGSALLCSHHELLWSPKRAHFSFQRPPFCQGSVVVVDSESAKVTMATTSFLLCDIR